MAGINGVTVNYRKSKKRISHPAFNSGTTFSERTNQMVTPTGASRSVRPMLTALRRMDSRGTGTVSYF